MKTLVVLLAIVLAGCMVPKVKYDSDGQIKSMPASTHELNLLVADVDKCRTDIATELGKLLEKLPAAAPVMPPEQIVALSEAGEVAYFHNQDMQAIRDVALKAVPETAISPLAQCNAPVVAAIGRDRAIGVERERTRQGVAQIGGTVLGIAATGEFIVEPIVGAFAAAAANGGDRIVNVGSRRTVEGTPPMSNGETGETSTSVSSSGTDGYTVGDITVNQGDNSVVAHDLETIQFDSPNPVQDISASGSGVQVLEGEKNQGQDTEGGGQENTNTDNDGNNNGLF